MVKWYRNRGSQPDDHPDGRSNTTERRAGRRSGGFRRGDAGAGGQPERAVSVFTLESGKQGTRKVAAKPVATPRAAHQARPPFGDKKRLSGHAKECKLIKDKEDADGDWKGF